MALVGAACAPGQPAASPTPDPAAPISGRVVRTDPGITAEDLRQRLYTFADDSMLGRESGTIGNVKATDYLAAELRRIGVEPAGENGTYFQTLPFYRVARDTTATIAVNGQALVVDQDYIVFPSGESFGGNADLDGVQVVYGGPMGDANALGPEQAKGRFVIFGPPTAPMAVEQEIAAMPRRYADAVGIAFAFLEFVPGPAREFLTGPQMKVGMEAEEGPVGLLITTQAAAKMLGTPMGGATVGQGAGVLGGNVRFSETAVETPARNVVGVVRGSDPALSHQYVAIGAHSDHVGISSRVVDHDSLRAYNRVIRPQGAEDQPRTPRPDEQARIRALLEAARRTGYPRPDSINNGADDDGSGSMTVLELAEAFAKTPEKPRRSILFVWHTGEEKGLLGAAYFTDNPTVPRDSIVAQINMDMVGRGGVDDVEGGGPGYVQVIGSRRLSQELGDLVETVNTTGGYDLTFDYQYDADGHPQQFYCRSDHYEYARFGIPVAFFSTGSHPDYHMVTDEPEYIDYPKMQRIASYVFDLVSTVANLDHRVRLNGPKPDPKAACVQ